MSLIIGIPACAKLVNEQSMHQTPARYAAAVIGGAGALPVMIPPMGEIQLGLLEHLHGLLVPGSPSNVHPTHYHGGDSETPGSHDMERDHTTLPLIRAAIGTGLPVLAICRGIQELNVALGGTLIQQVHERSGRLDHRGGDGKLEQRYGPKHWVHLNGYLAQIVGAERLKVNSLHGQAIDRLAQGLVVEAMAPDGTIEAVRLAEPAQGRNLHSPAMGSPLARADRSTPPTGRSPLNDNLGVSQGPWVLGVQWHPEWEYAQNPSSIAIFRAFGDACRAYRHHRVSGADATG